MNYKSILPDGYVPSRECIDWLRNEQQRLFDAHGKAVRDFYNADSTCAKDYRHLQILSLFTQAVHIAYLDAYDRWINQHAFDWMKGGEF